MWTTVLSNCRMTAWLPVCLDQRFPRGRGAGLTGRWKSEEGHRGRGIGTRDPPQEREVPVGRRDRWSTGSEVSKQGRSGPPSGWSRGCRRAGRRLEQGAAAVLTGKVGEGFGTSFADSQELREERGLAVPECWLCYKGYRSRTPTLCPALC